MSTGNKRTHLSRYRSAPHRPTFLRFFRRITSKLVTFIGDAHQSAAKRSAITDLLVRLSGSAAPNVPNVLASGTYGLVKHRCCGTARDP